MRRFFAVLAVALALTVSAFQPTAYAEPPQETSKVPYGREQSKGVEYRGYKDEGDVWVFTYAITDQAEGDLVLDFSKAITDFWENGSQLPGDSYKFKIEILNESGKEYRYKDGSFVIAPGDTSDFGSFEDGSMLPVLTYDGQYMPVDLSGAMIPYYFYDGVFGVASSNDVTFEMMCQIYDKLAEKGYTGDTAISDYMLKYYNDKRGTDYKSLTELFGDHPDWLDGNLTTSNSLWTMSKSELDGYIKEYPWIKDFVRYEGSGDSVKVQIKWPEPELAAASYNSFYTGLFSVVFGEENVNNLNPNGDGVEFSRAHAVGDYLPGTDLYNEANAYFDSLTEETPLEPEGQITVWTGYGIDGPGMGNSYENYSFTYFNQIELEEVAPVTIEPVDITIYTGGEDYDGTVSDGEGNIATSNGFPTPGFIVNAPEGVEDFDPAEAQLVYDDGAGDRRVWDINSYDGTTGNHNL